MKVIKIRSIDEALSMELPPLPKSFYEDGMNLQKRVETGNMSRHAVLRGIYELVDKVGEFMYPYTVCSSGCSSCCNIAVGVTELEATYIERNTGRKVKRGVISSGRLPSSPGKCPMLTSDGRCGIYAYRPFACRVYAAFDDPGLCAQLDVAHVTYTAGSNVIYQKTASWVKFLNKNGAIADIREFFC